MKAPAFGRRTASTLGAFLAFSILATAAATAAGLVEGVNVRFVSKNGQEHFGTIKELSSGKFLVLKPDGQGEDIMVENLESYKSTGQRQTITPRWSYIEQNVLIYELVKTSGEVTRGGFSSSPVWWIVENDGTIWRTGGTDFLEIERAAAVPAAKAKEDSPPSDLNHYDFRVITDNEMEAYMDRWGKGYVHDTRRGTWIRIPDLGNTIMPGYTKTSDTMVLVYSWKGAAVYDTDLGRFLSTTIYEGRTFAPFTRTETRDRAAQCNDDLAMVAGTAWNAVYDRSLHRWVQLRGGADDSWDTLDDNLVLATDRATIKILNDGYHEYELGKGAFSETKSSGRAKRSSDCTLRIRPNELRVAPGDCAPLPAVDCRDRTTGERCAPTSIRWNVRHGPGTPYNDRLCVSREAHTGSDEVLIVVSSSECEDRDILTVLVR